MRAEASKDKSRKLFHWLIFLMIVYFGYVGYQQEIHMINIDRDMQEASAQLEALQKDNAALREEKAKLNRPEYIEKIAREELGLVKEGEMPYITAKEPS